jgi:murein DD-endopeptidase MepM/ murein hydrolase activator NlpD
MNERRIRTGLALIFSAAIASAVGLMACSPNEAPEPAAVGDDSDGDIDATFAPPSDDPDADDADGLETAEEASIDDGILAADALEESEIGEVDVTDVLDPTEDLATPQAAKRVRSPVPGRGVTYPYGVKNPRYAAGFHTGQDHAAPKGTAVVAVRSGKIRWSNNRGGAYGRWMGLDADNGRTYVYCHLSSRRFKAGTRVKAGQRIGRVGATGNVTGPHLHFEDHPKGPFRYAQVRKPKW